MIDPFHEAREALQTAKLGLTFCNSLNVTAAYAANQACENTFRALWELSTGELFPHDAFRPHHKPSVWVERVGILHYYSSETQFFLSRLKGWALDDVRYVGSQPYIDHTKPSAAERGREIVAGTDRFIEESEALAKRSEVVMAMRQFRKTAID